MEQAQFGLEIDPYDYPDKESLKNIVSPMSQSQQDADFNLTTDVQEKDMFQKIDK